MSKINIQKQVQRPVAQLTTKPKVVVPARIASALVVHGD